MDQQVPRERLQALRERLLGVRHSIENDGVGERLDESISELASADNHPADIGTEMFERAKDMSLIESVDARLVDVDHALHKLEAGSYGVCETCGRPIAAERLEAEPAARHCVEDQERLERASRAP